jgi:hypothetical protein
LVPPETARAASGPTSSSRQQVKTPTNVQGRVNHAIAREAQESPNVLLSMILANSAPACALSELGASHSFVTIFFDKLINMHFEFMNAYMLIEAPGSKFRSNHIHRDFHLGIEGVNFLASLIVLSSEGIFNIAGMD